MQHLLRQRRASVTESGLRDIPENALESVLQGHLDRALSADGSRDLTEVAVGRVAVRSGVVGDIRDE